MNNMEESNFIQNTLLFAIEVGKDVNELRKRIGKLNDLNTQDKLSLVNAVNEIKASIDNIGDVSDEIPDWSEELNQNTNF